MSQDTAQWHRVYFNCRDHYPHLWAIDQGTIASQIRVQWVDLEPSCHGATDVGKKVSASPDPGRPLDNFRADRKGKPNEPTVWIETFGIAIFGQGGCIIEPPK